MKQRDEAETIDFSIVFAGGSNNFYTASLFFSKPIRKKITILYAFVRIIDNFVDAIPQQAAEFKRFERQYHSCLAGNSVPESIYSDLIAAFVNLQIECTFEQSWIDAFFSSMRLDLQKKTYHSLAEISEYMYGSAEIIGLCACRILSVVRVAERYACLYGRALQYINFIRDIKEDNQFGRRYLPLHNTSLPDLSQETARAHPRDFDTFVRAQIKMYYMWITEGRRGFKFITPHARVAMLTTANIFNRIAHKIYRKPHIVFMKKVKLSRFLILLYAACNMGSVCLQHLLHKIAQSVGIAKDGA